MRPHIIFGAALAALVAFAQAAVPQATAGSPDVPDSARIVLGITASTSGTDRDTLGLLVSAVTPGGPADRANVGVGNRLAEINGVSLRIGAADVGRRQAQDAALRRLAQAAHATQPGDSATLRLYGGGRYRTVAIHTVKTGEPRPVPGVAAAPSPVWTLKGVIEGIGDLRAQLNRLIQNDSVPARRDTLMRAQLDLGAIEARLRAAQGEPRRDSSVASVPGLRTTPIGDELTDYFGADSKGGLLVLECDSTWAPIQKGDVLLRVNGETVDLGLLRSALDPRSEARVDLMRHGRPLTVTLHPRA